MSEWHDWNYYPDEENQEVAKQQVPAIPAALASMTNEQLDEMIHACETTGDELRAYKAHRNAPVKSGVARGTFNFGNFEKNFAGIYNFVTALIGTFGGPKLPPLPPGLGAQAGQG